MHFIIREPKPYIEPVQSVKASSRLTVLDLTRFVAMLMMMQGHTIFALADPASFSIETFPWNVWQFLRSITAPVFLTLSGLVHVFANKRDERGRLPGKTVYKRARIAVILLVIGYMLDFPVGTVFDLTSITDAQWLYFLKTNILQIFGVTLLALLGFYIITRNDKQLGIISLAVGLFITFMTPIVLKTDWHSFMPDFIAQYLTFGKGSLFTIFPYSAFIFYGSAIGVWLKSLEPEKRSKTLMKLAIPVGFIFLSLSYLIGESYAKYDHFFLSYEINNPGLTFLRLSMVLFQIFVCGVLLKFTEPLAKWYSLYGKRAIFIYVVHLAIIYGTGFFPSLAMLFEQSLSVYYTLPMALGVIALSMLIVYAIDRILKAGGRAKKLMYGALVFYLLFLMFF